MSLSAGTEAGTVRKSPDTYLEFSLLARLFQSSFVVVDMPCHTCLAISASTTSVVYLTDLVDFFNQFHLPFNVTRPIQATGYTYEDTVSCKHVVS